MNCEHSSHHHERTRLFKNCLMLVPALLFLLSPGAGRVQAQSLQPDCYESDGKVNLSTCSTDQNEIPATMLTDGFYDLHGVYVPFLPADDLKYLDAGLLLKGNLLFMGQTHSDDVLHAKAAKWNLDETKFVGLAATSSCHYINTSMWIVMVNPDTPEATPVTDGPYLVGDCARPQDACLRIRDYQAVAEIDKAGFQKYQESGTLSVIALFASSDNYAPPTIPDLSQAPTYADKWAAAPHNPCPYG